MNRPGSLRARLTWAVGLYLGGVAATGAVSLLLRLLLR